MHACMDVMQFLISLSWNLILTSDPSSKLSSRRLLVGLCSKRNLSNCLCNGHWTASSRYLWQARIFRTTMAAYKRYRVSVGTEERIHLRVAVQEHAVLPLNSYPQAPPVWHRTSWLRFVVHLHRLVRTTERACFSDLPHTGMEVPLRRDVVVVGAALLQATGFADARPRWPGPDLAQNLVRRDSPEMLTAVFQQPRPSSKVLWR